MAQHNSSTSNGRHSDSAVNSFQRYQDPEMNHRTARRKPAELQPLPLFDALCAGVAQSPAASGRRQPESDHLFGKQERAASGKRPSAQSALNIRQSKKEAIAAFFAANLGAYISTVWLHSTFGPSFRSRVSDINKDSACPIIIRQTGKVQGDKEISHYWSEKR